MQYFTTVTSQGQITIPSQIRNSLGISRNQKVIIELDNDSARIRPVADIDNLSGVLREYGEIYGGESIKDRMKNEKDAIADARIDKLVKKKK